MAINCSWRLYCCTSSQNNSHENAQTFESTYILGEKTLIILNTDDQNNFTVLKSTNWHKNYSKDPDLSFPRDNLQHSFCSTLRNTNKNLQVIWFKILFCINNGFLIRTFFSSLEQYQYLLPTKSKINKHRAEILHTPLTTQTKKAEV